MLDIAATDPSTGSGQAITNSGTLAGRRLVSLTAENIRNLGGTIKGEEVTLGAENDIEMRGGTIEAGSRLDLLAGGNIDIASSTHSSENKEGGDFSRTNIDRVAGLYVQNPGGTLQLAAAGDITLLAAHLINTAPTAAGLEATAGDGVVAGSTRIDAGGNLTLGTLAVEEKNHTGGKGYRNESGSRREAGTRIESQGDVTLVAGGTLAARAAEVTSTQGDILAGANDIVLEAGEASSYSDISQQKKRSGFLSSKSKSQRDAFADTSAVASTFSGENVTLVAERDVQVKGSNVAGTNDATLIAGRDLAIEAATETHSETHVLDKKKSGFLSSGLDALNKTRDEINAKGSVVRAGRDLELIAGAANAEAAFGDGAQPNSLPGNLTLQGSALDAGRDLAIQTTGDLQLLAAYSQSRETTQRTTQTRRKLETLNFDLDQTRALLATLTAGNSIDLNV
ncbi:MAG: filamentous hemagglutinin, partial [Pseudomonadota bacterium]|nr:filamentous hemagglutinin [Pseudomonadota bacterium]